ncbi:NADH-quinone oxidoreductase subunit L [Duncaniella freteri]|jgi:NADH-quinone oxidoreductase subunit L|uniref:NADH-quinone oxidoreductase subunit L n=11 Tax=Duncaniella TaxID=2518495 RepID=A0A4Z0V4P7_9BACT|nr:NADH-quinone oxidoreductase subunit L [Duncaniella freteri]NBJ05764.1 NADH-quinone oxidoreductase subunit L [Alistipes sp. Z76]NCE67773.1 NADH-quinone oxidoreductase subunit L [Muribaculaceae bacterium M3]TGG39771.1 NADH-quinone oxidoreductase subunit L [Duncaniella freteri]
MDITIPVLILAIPFFMFLLLGLAGVKMSHKMAGTLGTIGMGTVLVLSYYTAFTYWFSGAPEFIDGTTRLQYTVFNQTWLQFTPALAIKIGFLLDPISALMLVVIPTISFMVHVYSLGYMHGEKGFQRYYAFLSLFSFSMLGLVVATNIFQMYIFWELVGASSFLLIGFFYTLPSAVAACKKAFIVTRFADLGFLIGILILSFYTEQLDFLPMTQNPQAVFESFGGATFMGASVLTWALVLIFTGGMGKSAMLPLHIWLPDAMEGPTPVSALIHAATMVVAGVYLVARLFPLYMLEDAALTFITVVGAITAFYAACVACAQIDIKRILAFSTISQIAFMMVALGVASKYGEAIHEGLGYMASMFHLFTHAMFKALLFLGAGSLIHAVHSNNYTAMGGLRKYMPITHITFLIGCLAIAGIWPFAGFFSKDEILTACFANSTFWGIWMMIVAAMTAFYMFRMYFLIFWWDNPDYEARVKEQEAHGHHASMPHESPFTMAFPLVFLAIVSCVAGWVPFGELVTFDGHEYHIHIDWSIASMSMGVAILAIAFAAWLYMKKNDKPARMADSCRWLWTAANRRFYWDEIYLWITRKVIFDSICKPIAWFDRHIIDGTMDGFAYVTNVASGAIKGLQSGKVQMYVWWFLIGAVLLGVIAAVCVL